MRAGLSTIQQTLTPEAASVLNHSIAEASRRNHGQTTPLHVASTLLASPSGFLRQACIKSHPNSSHPLQCRALELCFSVALERLPTAQNLNSGLDPPISNALMAALKRAQAHQRRGCPEQQQQPLLAVKVELEQLIISILDDPSVSRVMREASFSSPAVKATIEQSLNSSPANSTAAAAAAAAANSTPIGLGFRPPGAVAVPTPTAVANRNLYVNPRLQQGGAAQSGQQRSDEVKRVIDILLRSKKKNPVLVGDSELETVVKEVLKRIESKEVGDHGALKDVQVIHLEKEFLESKGQVPERIVELGGLIESRVGNSECGGVILDLGDLKWLVEQPGGLAGAAGVQQQQVVSEAGRTAVAEMGKLLARFGEGSSGGGRLWLIGTATCETYLRCQVYHPSMESDWDLQAVPIAARAPLPGMFPRLGANGILSSTVESLSPLKGFPTVTLTPTRRLSENLGPTRRISCCPQCQQNYEQELAKIVPQEFQKPSSEVKAEVTQPQLPQWLKDAKGQDGAAKTLDQTATKDQELLWKHKTSELQKKWQNTCLHLHPGHHQPTLGSERMTQPAIPVTSLYNQNLLHRQPFQPKLNLKKTNIGTLPVNPNLLLGQPPVQATTPPGSPVRTDLVLGRPKTTETTTPEKGQEERTRDFLGSVPPEPQSKLHELPTNKFLTAIDLDFKKLLKGFTEKVWWQRDAASAVATTVTQCRLGNRKRQGTGSMGDIWLLFSGPDRIGKKRMASALSDQMCGSNPIVVSLGSRRDDGESFVSFRGKTVLDRIAEAVRRNPFSVIILEDIDEADMLVRGSIKRAMERGRISDSLGREISLGNVIFILTANWSPDNPKHQSTGISLDDKKLTSLASGDWQLRLTLCQKTAKRRANWLHNEDRTTKPRKHLGLGLSFDLNEALDAGDDRADGSHNSSDLTIDHEEEHALTTRLLAPTASSLSRELLNSLDDHIVFKPVDFTSICSDVSDYISKKFSSIMIEGLQIEIEEEALEKIASGLWLSRMSVDEWSENALVPNVRHLKMQLPRSADEFMVVRLELDSDSGSRNHEEWLPSKIRVVVDGL
ncbi:hypothetical protein Tsubulata_045913 [Turnera subulata]|uniref:Clp R domain-containing protein n=1 Tax=Turnera subulata TaxID=218843 RepID=A0A9Q0F348_9ROSI|nr:hypothetical protein Tsubulata_045913 [Turnera subulata]